MCVKSCQEPHVLWRASLRSNEIFFPSGLTQGLLSTLHLEVSWLVADTGGMQRWRALKASPRAAQVEILMAPQAWLQDTLAALSALLRLKLSTSRTAHS